MAYIFGSPGRYIQGKGEMGNIGKYASPFGKKLFVITNQFLFDKFKNVLDRNERDYDVQLEYAIFADECTYSEMRRLTEAFKKTKSEVVIGVGGGKALDTAKGVATYCGAPLAIVPTSAAQDAPCSSVSVVYKENGEFDSFMFHKANPNLVIVDSQVICEAPARMIAAGMGDGLSTLFESRACVASDVENGVGGKATQTAPVLARLCYKIIMENGRTAYRSVEKNVVTKALEAVIEANIYLSGLGAEGTGDAGAHGIYNALTLLKECRAYLHGELVSFGILVQLVLENESVSTVNEILSFCTSVNLPVCLADIGVDKSNEEALRRVAAAAAADTLVNMPFEVTADDVYGAIIIADAIGTEYKSAQK